MLVLHLGSERELATINIRGTFPLRGHVVIYGDILDGTIRNGDLPHLRVNRGMPRTVRINSVEAVDGTPTGSHVALVTPKQSSRRWTWSETC